MKKTIVFDNGMVMKCDTNKATYSMVDPSNHVAKVINFVRGYEAMDYMFMSAQKSGEKICTLQSTLY